MHCNVALRVFFIIHIGLVVVLPASAQSTQSITIIVNPGPFASIEQAAIGEEQVDFWDGDFSDDDACMESYAAVELKRFLSACTAIKENSIKLSSSDKLPKKGYVFVLGNRNSNSLLKTIKLPSGKKTEFTRLGSFRICAFEKAGRTICVIEGNTRVGTLYGVDEYLERLGMRFFGLGEKGTVYPDEPVSLIRKLDVVENPAYINRGYWNHENPGHEIFFEWMARNRMNFWIIEPGDENIHLMKKLGLTLSGGGHDVQKICLPAHGEYPYNCPLFNGDENKPDDPYKISPEYEGDTNGDGKLDYFEAHPEWFGLFDGKRSDKQVSHWETTESGSRTLVPGSNYCTSNDDATKELAKNLVRELIEGKLRYTDYFNYWMIDGGKWCECDKCKPQKNKMDVFLHIVYLTNKAVQQARQENRLKRDIHMVTLAYSIHRAPPSQPLPDDFDYDHISVTFFPMQRCYTHLFWDPNCTEGAARNKQYYEWCKGWTVDKDRHYKGTFWMGEYYNVSHHVSLPVLYTRIMKNEIPFFYHHMGTQCFHFMHVITGDLGTWTLNQYLLARLLWNPDVDANAVLDEYFQKYYPTTTESTRSFYRHLEEAYSNITFMKVRWPERSYRECKDANAALLPWDHFHYEAHHPEKNDAKDMVEIVESIQLARRELDQSLINCTDLTEQKRLLEDQRRFAYGENMVYYFYHQLRTLMFDRRADETMARYEFARLKDYAEKLRAYKHVREYGSSSGSGFGGICRSPYMHNYLKDKYGDPKK